jgi:hypothetical protein
VLIECLADQGLDHGLAADIEVLSGSIQFLQHAGSDVDVDALNRLNHSPFALEEARNVLPLIG